MNPLDASDFDNHLRAYKQDFTPDVSAGLRRLHERLEADAPPRARVRSLNRRSWWAAAATVALLVAAGYFILVNSGRSVLENTSDEPLAYALPDGTRVVLAPGAELSHREDYNQDARQVLLEGQAYFEVAKDPLRPFLVQVEDTELRVTGTAFNLRVVEGEVEVEVSEGSVQLTHAGDVIPLQAMQCGRAQPGKKCTVTDVSSLNRHAWRTGKLQFDGAPFHDVVRCLSTNWGIQVAGGGDCDIPITASFTDVDPQAILETIVTHGQGQVVRGKNGAYEIKGVCQ